MTRHDDGLVIYSASARLQEIYIERGRAQIELNREVHTRNSTSINVTARFERRKNHANNIGTKYLTLSLPAITFHLSNQ